MSGSLCSEQMAVAGVPGYRRALRVEPGQGAVLAMLEDDLHAMAVRLLHDGERVVSVEPLMDRVPWTTCPGAIEALKTTFTGVALKDVSARRDKPLNCTHLHDLAVIAARHAMDERPLEYRISVSDPGDTRGGERVLEITRDGQRLHLWHEREGRFIEPYAIAGLTALTLRDWIARLQGDEQEAARLLQWASLVAHGRTMSDEQRHAALGVRANCFTMQPGRVEAARMANGLQDFSGAQCAPLDGLRERFEAAHGA